MSRLTFTAPPYGFEPETEFELVPVDGADGLSSLRATRSGVRVFVLDAVPHLAAYRPRIPAFELAHLGAPPESDDLRVLVVVNPSGDETTVNLAAPIVVTRSGGARQVILDGSDWPMRHPLAAALAAA